MIRFLDITTTRTLHVEAGSAWRENSAEGVALPQPTALSYGLLLEIWIQLSY